MAVPLHLLTGFLGAGKSTVLGHLLAHPRGEGIAVLVNEAGELALDHHLLETLDEGVLLLSSGCICCTIEGELFAAIERVLALSPSRIVVETTGIADPAPILHGLAHHPRLRKEIRVSGVISVVDAERGEMLLDEPEARAQVELSDRIVLSKVDLAPSRVAPLRTRLGQVAPAAEIREAANGEVEVDWLLAVGPSARLLDAAAGREWLRHPPGGDHRIGTRSIHFGGPVDEDALALWLRLVTQLDGDRLLRVKGILESRRSGGFFVLQSVQHAVPPLRPFEGRPRGWPGSSLVLLHRDAPGELVDRWVEFAHLAARGEPWTTEPGSPQPA